MSAEPATPADRPDEAVLADLGERLARRRLRLDLTQAELAEHAGVSRPTVQRIEAGESAQMTSLIRILRVLGLLVNLDLLAPADEVTPMERLEGRSRPRQRASSRDDDGGEAPPPTGWTWGEDRR